MQLVQSDSGQSTYALCFAALILTLFLAGGQLKGSSHSVHLLKGSSAAAAPEAAWAGAPRREGLEGFISATSTTSERHGLAKTSRAWRKGMRGYVATNAPEEELAALNQEGERHHEVWGRFNDTKLRFGDWELPGELRMAHAPWLAHRAYKGDYEWMLFGDDDTVFFLEGVMAAVAGLDPNDPYYLSDNYWSNLPIDPGDQPQKRGQPRCVPCTFNDTGLDLAALHAIKTCNCTAQLFCQQAWPREVGYTNCSEPPVESHHGGAGVILSVGLFRAANWVTVRPCLIKSRELGDKTLAQCLWKAGVAHTDPGWQARHPDRFLFDMWSGNVSSLAALVGAAARGACDSACREDMAHVVSLHLSARQYGSMEAAAEAALAVSALYDSYFNATSV